MYTGNSNKGSYIEKLIDNSAEFYLVNQIMLIEKKHVPFLFKKKDKEKVYGKIQKSTTDYYAIYNGKYYDFEVKQTEKNFFMLNQIKKHQMNHLKKVNSFGGNSFLLLHFFMEDQVFVIFYEKLSKIKSKITLLQCQELFIKVNVIFPGIIDFKKLFESLDE